MASRTVRRAPEAEHRSTFLRLLRVRYVEAGSMTSFLLFEGSMILGVLLALAELASWWSVFVLPATVALMVKINDLVAGGLARSAGHAVPRHSSASRAVAGWAYPAVAVGRATVPVASPAFRAVAAPILLAEAQPVLREPELPGWHSGQAAGRDDASYTWHPPEPPSWHESRSATRQSISRATTPGDQAASWVGRERLTSPGPEHGRHQPDRPPSPPHSTPPHSTPSRWDVGDPAVSRWDVGDPAVSRWDVDDPRPSRDDGRAADVAQWSGPDNRVPDPARDTEADPSMERYRDTEADPSMERYRDPWGSGPGPLSPLFTPDEPDAATGRPDRGWTWVPPMSVPGAAGRQSARHRLARQRSQRELHEDSPERRAARHSAAQRYG